MEYSNQNTAVIGSAEDTIHFSMLDGSNVFKPYLALQAVSSVNDASPVYELPFTTKGSLLASRLPGKNNQFFTLIEDAHGRDVRLSISETHPRNVVIEGPTGKMSSIVDCLGAFGDIINESPYAKNSELKCFLRNILKSRQLPCSIENESSQDKEKKAKKELGGSKNSLKINPGSMTINELSPATVNQERYVSLLDDNNVGAVMTQGPAGTGKTRLFLQVAMRKIRDYYRGVSGETYKRLVLSIPLVNVGGKELGALPGDVNQKTGPWFDSYYDHLVRILSPINEKGELNTKTGMFMLDALIKEGIIEIAPLEFLRGKSFDNTLLALDEAQNASHAQVLTFLTRAESTSRLFIFGDLEQADKKAMPSEAMRVPSTVKVDEQGIVSVYNQEKWIELGMHKDIGVFTKGREAKTLDTVSLTNGFAQALLLYSSSPQIACTCLTHDDIQRNGFTRDLLLLYRGLRIAGNEVTNLIPIGQGLVDPATILGTEKTVSREIVSVCVPKDQLACAYCG